jgi:hypothetical protein
VCPPFSRAKGQGWAASVNEWLTPTIPWQRVGHPPYEILDAPNATQTPVKTRRRKPSAARQLRQKMQASWSLSVAQAARAIDDAELSETRITQREYWATLNLVLDAAGGLVSGNKKPQPQSWMASRIGRSGFHLGAAAPCATKI